VAKNSIYHNFKADKLATSDRINDKYHRMINVITGIVFKLCDATLRFITDN